MLYLFPPISLHFISSFPSFENFSILRVILGIIGITLHRTNSCLTRTKNGNKLPYIETLIRINNEDKQKDIVSLSNQVDIVI